MRYFDSLGIAKRGEWFAVRRPDGRVGCWRFGSKYRAAECAVRAWKRPWPDLARAGVRVVAMHDVQLGPNP